MKNIIKPLIYCGFPLFLGYITSLLFSTTNYSKLNKPVLSPPGFVFPIAWGILYLLMGISFYKVNKYSIDKKFTKLFFIQLLLNYSWCFIFFTFKNYYLSFVCILLIITFVIFIIDSLSSYNKKIAYLYYPYFLWLLFALYLNAGIIFLN